MSTSGLDSCIIFSHFFEDKQPPTCSLDLSFKVVRRLILREVLEDLLERPNGERVPSNWDVQHRTSTFAHPLSA